MGREDVVRALLAQGARTTAVDEDGETAIHRAIHGQHEEIVQLLLVDNAHLHTVLFLHGPSLLLAACANGLLQVVRLLVQLGVKLPDCLNTRDGSSALHTAAWNGQLDVLRFLLEKGCDVNHRSNSCETALHFAVRNGQLEAVKILIEEGKADHRIKNREGKLASEMEKGFDVPFEKHRAIVSYLVDL